MTTPAPESVRRFVTRVEKGLSMIREACADLDIELRPGPDADFPSDRPAAERDLKRIRNRLESELLTDEERERFLARLEKPMTYYQARDILQRLDRELEAREDTRRHEETSE